jgi:hypothetical protein
LEAVGCGVVLVPLMHDTTVAALKTLIAERCASSWSSSSLIVVVVVVVVVVVIVVVAVVVVVVVVVIVGVVVVSVIVIVKDTGRDSLVRGTRRYRAGRRLVVLADCGRAGWRGSDTDDHQGRHNTFDFAVFVVVVMKDGSKGLQHKKRNACVRACVCGSGMSVDE